MKANLATTLTAASVAVLLTAVACGDKSATESPSTSSTKATSSSSSASSSAESTSAAAEQDYSALLITAEDIVSPGETFTAQAPTLNPNGQPGVATVFSNEGDTREIGDTILVLPDADSAQIAFQGAQSAMGASVVGGTPEVANVGTDSVILSGTSPDGSKAVTVLLFVEGAAFTTLEFDSLADDPVPPEAAVDIASKQDAKIKAGL